MRLIRDAMILYTVLLTAACGPQAPALPAKDKKVVASVAAPAPTPASNETAVSPAAPSDEEEHDDSRPTDEKGMYCCELEVMPYPPPMGLNGETTHFEPESNTALGLTGRIVFTGAPKANEPTQWLHMQAQNGLAYDLQVVDRGGVDAIGKLDWSKIMMQPIGMEDYLNKKSDEPGTVVFVYKVMREFIPAKSINGGLCPKTGYIALTVNRQRLDMMLVAFRPGPWPPKDDSTFCGSYRYVLSDQDVTQFNTRP